MGGGHSAGGVYVGSSVVTAAQDKAVRKIINQTQDLKREQARLIDENGNVVFKAKGEQHEVKFTVGDMRENGAGAVGVHNHPEGGTFSPDDFRAFAYGIKQTVVASPEGTYRLTNANYNTSKRYDGWRDMQNAAIQSGAFGGAQSYTQLRKQASESAAVKKYDRQIDKVTKDYYKARDAKSSAETLQNIYKQLDGIIAQRKEALHKEERRIVVEPAHKWLKENAKKYGFDYTFTPRGK